MYYVCSMSLLKAIGSSYLQQDLYKFWRVILDVDFNEN